MSNQPTGQMMLALQALENAVTTGTIEAIVPEALEEEAHNTLWRRSSRNELTLLKICPKVDTFSIKHEFDRIKSYGEERGLGFFGEETLPLETEPEFERAQTFVRLLGETSSTFLLASLEKTIKVDGQVGADAIARHTLLLNLLKKKNRAMYFSDTRTVRTGTSSLRFEGLAQQIEEGTDGTNGTSPYGTHVVDMEGLPLTVENIRSRTVQVITLFGFMNCLFMDPAARGDLEASMDSSQRNQLPIGFRPFFLGQNIGGFQTQGGQMHFHTDNALSPLYSQRQYEATAVRGAPTGTPSVTLTLNASPTGANVSKWNAGDAGDFFWIITEQKNERESLGTRSPASGAQAVAVGQEVQLDITPSDPLSDSFIIYRGDDGDADTEAWRIFEVANDGGGGAVTAYDLNQCRPKTTWAFGLNIRSEASEYLHAPVMSGLRDSYALAVEESERFLGQPDNEQNTVTLVTLGPDMGVLELATLLATTSRPLLYSACAIQVRNPLQNIAFKNVGSTANELL